MNFNCCTCCTDDVGKTCFFTELKLTPALEEKSDKMCDTSNVRSLELIGVYQKAKEREREFGKFNLMAPRLTDCAVKTHTSV